MRIIRTQFQKRSVACKFPQWVDTSFSLAMPGRRENAFDLHIRPHKQLAMFGLGPLAPSEAY
jgi:hypothetical protein